MDSQTFFRINLEEISQIFDEKKSQLDLSLSNEKIKAAFKLMQTIRKFEERAADLYAKGNIAGFCHLYNGQEAVAVGNVFASEKDDAFITSYRDHGLMLACGGDPLKVMGELTGRAIGYSKGKGGSMHIFDLEKKFYGGHGIVGAQISLGTGIAFAMKYRNQQNVCYTYLGDGAVNQGQFYESMNMASLWGLPVIYVIENNGYAMGTSVSRSTYDTNFANRGLPFGIIGVEVDGMDLFDVYTKIKIARNYCLCEERPVLLSVKTYRYRGHSMSDPGNYRSKDEVEEYKKSDPIGRIIQYMIDKNISTEVELEKITDEIAQRMRNVATEALQAAEPDIDELYTDVYAK